MKLLEVKNNLVKISYSEEERVALGKFITISGEKNSYIAQIVNIKADLSSNNFIAKLLFVFDSNGIVNGYDGTVPSVQSGISFLPSKDILALIPVESPVKLGVLAQQNTEINVDKSFFEGNLTVCAEKYDNISDIVYNFVTELSKYNDKTVVIDTDNNFEGYESLKFRKDFRIPLNCGMIDFLFENELKDVDASSKAVVEEIFSEVREYAKTVDFIPFETFMTIISQQYDATHIPELALLKSKLKKYNEENIFVQLRDEFDALQNFIIEKRIAFLNIADLSDELQCEVIKYIYSSIEALNGTFYSFVKLNNKNSNKKLLKQILDSKKIYTTVICNHMYTYLPELKQFADDLIFFAPQTVQHDFASYNVFLNKLNQSEFIVYGAHTYNIPFIVDINASLSDNDSEDDIDTSDELNIQNEQSEADVLVPQNEVHNEENLNTAEEVMSGGFKSVVEEMSNADNTSEDKNLPQEDNLQALNDVFPVVNDTPADDNKPAIDNSNLNINGPEFAPEPLAPVDDEPVDNISESEVTEPLTDVPEDVIGEDLKPEHELTHDELVEQVAKDVDEVFITNKTHEIPPIENLLEDDLNADNSELTEADLDFLDELPPQEVELSDKEEEVQTEEVVTDDLDAVSVNEEEMSENTGPVADDLNFADDADLSELNTDITEDDILPQPDEELIQEDLTEDLPVYPTEEPQNASIFEQGDMVSHPKYGRGVIEKLIKYGNKTLCSISFEEVGRRLLDPAISELQKV